MEKYKELEMEIIEFQQEDVIVTSCSTYCDSDGVPYCPDNNLPCTQVV